MEYKSELHLQAVLWQEFYKKYKQYRLPPVGNKPRCLLVHNLLNPKSSVEGAKLQGAGLTKGFPDLTLFVARKSYHGLHIELKINKEKPKKEQVEVFEALRAQGYKVIWGNNHVDILEEIENYLR